MPSSRLKWSAGTAVHEIAFEGPEDQPYKLCEEPSRSTRQLVTRVFVPSRDVSVVKQQVSGIGGGAPIIAYDRTVGITCC